MCLKLVPLDLNRYQIQYPLKRSNKKTRLIGDKPLEMNYLLIDLVDSDTATFSFSEKFSNTPNAIAGLVTPSGSIGNVNVYISDLTSTGGTVKTSAPVTAKVIIQAIYVEP